MTIEQLFWLIIFLLTLVALASFIWVFAPYFPTRKGHLNLIAELAALKPGETFYELGCGDGRVSRAVATAFPAANIIGLEMAGPLFFWSWCKAKLGRYKNIKIKWKNIFWQSLNDADVVYVFGMKESLNAKLKDKFLAELKPGARIISYVFTMADWPGKTEVFSQKTHAKDQTKITVYTVPKKK